MKKRVGNLLRGGRAGRTGLILLAFSLCLTASGCIATLNVDPASAAYQKLATRSLERALARLDVERFAGKRLTVEVLTLTEEDYRPFAREFITANFKERGLTIVRDAEKAELKLEVFLPSFGVNQEELYIGTPDLPSPLGTIPRTPIIGRLRDVGRTEIEIYAFDRQSGAFVTKTQRAEGEATFTINTLFVIFLFTSSDVDEKRRFTVFPFSKWKL